MAILDREPSMQVAPKGGGYLVEVLIGLLLASCTYGIPMVWGISGGGDFVAVASILSVVVCLGITTTMGPTGFLSYWIVLSVTQNFFVGIWHGSSSAEIPIVVTESKTITLVLAMLIYAAPLFGFLRNRRKIFLLVLAYLLIVLMYVRAIDASALAYLRNFLAPLGVLLLAAAITERISRNARIHFASVLCLSVVLLMLAGSLAELVIGTEGWRLLVNANSSGALSSLSESTSLLGVNLPRTGGILVEPTNAGYVAAIAVLIFTLQTAADRLAAGLSRFSLVGVSGGLIVIALAAAKSGALILVIAAVCVVLFRSRLMNTISFTLGWIVSFMMTAAYVAFAKGAGALGTAFSNPIAIVGGDSTTFHFAGFIYGMRSLLGHGVGVGGNFNRNPGQPWSEWLGTGSESAWGVLAYQTGLLGLLLWLVVLCAVGGAWGRASAVLLCAWAAGAMFAEAMIGPQVAGLAMVGAALLRAENLETFGGSRNVGKELVHT